MRALFYLFMPAVLAAQVNVPFERIRDANNEPGNWLTYSRDYSGQRYSPLDQVNTANVSKLHIAWMRQVDETDTFETSAIVVDGTLFVTEPPNIVEALDAVTGRSLWSYRRELPRDLRLCCGRVNRGLAILGDSVYYASTDAHLIALDVRTGNPRWDVTMADYKRGYSSTGAPLAVKDKIITGMAGGEFPCGNHVRRPGEIVPHKLLDVRLDDDIRLCPPGEVRMPLHDIEGATEYIRHRAGLLDISRF